MNVARSAGVPLGADGRNGRKGSFQAPRKESLVPSSRRKINPFARRQSQPPEP